MHPTNTEDAPNRAGQSQMCRVLETPNTLCNRSLSFLLLGFLANFPEYFPEKRVMRNGFSSLRYPPTARYGVFGVSTWPLGCDTPSPFSDHFPLESMRNGGAIPPHKKGISAILARYPMNFKTRQNACDTPLCDTISKGYCAIWGGGVSRTGPLSQWSIRISSKIRKIIRAADFQLQKSCRCPCRYPPGHRANICRKENLGQFIFARIHVGPAFALARTQEIFLRNCFPYILPGYSFRCENMPGLYSPQRKYRRNWQIIMHWFRARGMQVAMTMMLGLPLVRAAIWPNAQSSGKKKEHKLKLLGLDIFCWGGGLPHEGAYCPKVRYVPWDPGKTNVLRDILKCRLGYHEGARKV